MRDALPPDKRVRQKVVVAPNSVDTDRFFPAKDKVAAKLAVGAPTDQPLVLMLANLSPHKGQTTVIRAIAELKRKGIRATCWLAGVERDGQAFTESLKGSVKNLGLEKDVKLLGFRSDSPELMRAADIFVLPSTREGLPISLVEAQATGVPVIAAPTAGVPEVVSHRVTGLIAAADDHQAYAQGIEALIENGDLRQTIIQNAHQQATGEYNWTGYRNRIFGVYEQLLGNKNARNTTTPIGV